MVRRSLRKFNTNEIVVTTEEHDMKSISSVSRHHSRASNHQVSWNRTCISKSTTHFLLCVSTSRSRRPQLHFYTTQDEFIATHFDRVGFIPWTACNQVMRISMEGHGNIHTGSNHLRIPAILRSKLQKYPFQPFRSPLAHICTLWLLKVINQD